MKIQTRGVLAYLLLTFGLAWSAFFVARLLLGLSLENSLVQLPIAFSPAIAAVVVRGWITKEGFADAGLALHLRRGWAYYLAAWLFPLITVGVVIGLATVLGISRPELTRLGALFPGLPLPGWAGLPVLIGVPILTMPLFWGEEFGWRGYLQVRLLSHSPLKAAIATGFVWTVWHYPLFFLGYSEYANPFIGLVTSTVFAILLAIILAWLRLHPRSAWISNLAHAGTNMVLATIAFITSRESRQGRPLPSGRRDGAGIKGSTMFHCSSVRSMPLWCNLMKLASSQTRSPVLRSGGPLQ